MPTTTVKGIDEIRKLAGQDLGHSEWLEITQDRIQTFADATGDQQWIHVDVERASNGPFGAPIAHGYLTLSLVMPLWTGLLVIEGIDMAVNYGLNKVRFPAPVPVGSRIRLAARVTEVTDVPGGVQLAADFTVEREGEGEQKPACVAQVVHRYLGM